MKTIQVKDMKAEIKTERLDQLIARYRAFTKWVLRCDPEILRSQRGKDFLQEIDRVESKIRKQENDTKSETEGDKEEMMNFKRFVNEQHEAININWLIDEYLTTNYHKQYSVKSIPDEYITVDDGSVMGARMKRSEYDAQFKSSKEPNPDNTPVSVRDSLIKLVQEARKGCMCINVNTDNTYWQFDNKSESKIVDDYLSTHK